MNKQSSIRFVTTLLSSGLTVGLALILGAALLWITGKNPVEAYRLLITRGLGSSFGITETLIKMAPLLMVSAGLLVAIKAGVWNIGMDGQLLFGASLVGIVAPRLVGNMPHWLMLLLAAGVGLTGGALWGLIPALLKIRYSFNEIITTVMMNYLAIYLTGWFVKGPFKDATVVAPQMPVIPPAFRLPAIPYTRVHVGLLVGLLAVMLVYWLFRSTILGFKLTVLGQSRQAAIHAGMPVDRLTALAFVLSAGLAGLAGSNDILGVKGLFQGEWNPAYGLIGFALVFLARLNALLVIPFAYFFAFLLFGSELMARTAKIPAFFVEVLEGLMLVFIAIRVSVERKLQAE
jgi:simple sugar transport system permease protein